MNAKGINWERTINRFGWYLVGIALGCLMVGLMLRAKASFLGTPPEPTPGAASPAPVTPATPAPTPGPSRP